MGMISWILNLTSLHQFYIAVVSLLFNMVVLFWGLYLGMVHLCPMAVREKFLEGQTLVFVGPTTTVGHGTPQPATLPINTLIICQAQRNTSLPAWTWLSQTIHGRPYMGEWHQSDMLAACPEWLGIE